MQRILIVGAGLSGLCLAQRMLREGWQVSVIEKDDGPSVRGQGYRLTIDLLGAQALKACLLPKAHEFIRRTAKIPAEDSGFSFLDERARELFRFSVTRRAVPNTELIVGQVDRQTLREGLLIGLESSVSFAKTLSRYEITSDEVIAFLGDGSEIRADVLVGADGVYSTVRQMRLASADTIETGISAIFGRTSLGASSLPVLRPRLAKDGVLALGPKGVNLFCTTMQFPEQPASVSKDLGISTTAGHREDYIMWGVAGRFLIQRTVPAEVRDLALELIGGFHPDFKVMLQEAEPNETIATVLRTTPKLHPWNPNRVTLIGDAIHAMPPFGANGANTALRDAQSLGNCLVNRSWLSIEERIGKYEFEMREYGSKAIKRSLRMMKMTTNPSPVVRAALRGVFRLMNLF